MKLDELGNELQRSLANWLDAVSADLPLGRFRFCLDGGLVPVMGKAGQVSTCFAMKAAWQSGLWSSWEKFRRDACVGFVSSFQEEDGYFRDPWLQRESKISFRDIARLLLKRASLRDTLKRGRNNVRAETRQSAASLIMAGSKPAYRLPLEEIITGDAARFVESLDWTNPWAAGSRISHLMFFLSVNQRYFSRSPSYKKFTDELCTALESFHHSDTGGWYRGRPASHILVNGAMKVLSGLHWLDRPYPDCTALVNFALAQPFEKDGCSFLDRLYVVYEGRRGCPENYRRSDILQLGREALEQALRFRRRDGGFSFNRETAQTHYYGVKVSSGGEQGDLHGAAMITWALALAFNLLGCSGWNCQTP